MLDKNISFKGKKLRLSIKDAALAIRSIRDYM